MRILYAAGDRIGANLQLKRFIPLFNRSKHNFKLATFKNSAANFHFDYCLDALIDFIHPEENRFSFNNNFQYYTKELDKFAPDLIISDLELYSSIYAIEKNIPLWQVSPLLLYYGVNNQTKYRIGIHKTNAKLISGNRSSHQYIKSILNNSSKKLILSCIGDTSNPPELKSGYEWCRPTFELFTHQHPQPTVGFAIHLHDNFYNHIFSIINCDWTDLEQVINSKFFSYFKLGKLEQENSEKSQINIELNNQIKFLSGFYEEFSC